MEPAHPPGRATAHPEIAMRRPSRRHLAGHFVHCAAVGALAAAAGPAGATLLTFDWTRDSFSGAVTPTASPSDLPADYGDRVTGAAVAVPGGSFLYDERGEGYTPNVVVDISGGGATATDPRVRLWVDSFGDLRNVVFGAPGSGFMEARLVADPGFEAVLHGFDLGGYPGSDWTIDSVQVLAGATVLYAQADALIEGNTAGARHTPFDFATPMVAPELTIRIDYSNLSTGRQDNIGLDNLRFGQTPPGATPPVPEPGTAWLLAAGLAWGWRRVRRRAGAGAS
jgi:hypothetical protein